VPGVGVGGLSGSPGVALRARSAGIDVLGGYRGSSLWGVVSENTLTSEVPQCLSRLCCRSVGSGVSRDGLWEA